MTETNPTGVVSIIPVPGIPEVRAGDDLAAVILDACGAADLQLQLGDVLVVTHKVVSKAEGRIVDLGGIIPSDLATRFAHSNNKDPRQVEVLLL